MYQPQAYEPGELTTGARHGNERHGAGGKLRAQIHCWVMHGLETTPLSVQVVEWVGLDSL